MKIVRVLRGMLGTALTWGVAWAPLSIGFIGLYALLGAPMPPVRFWDDIILGSVFRGVISGTAFAGLLSIVARRRSFAELRFPQLMACGAAGAFIAPAVSIAGFLLSSPVSIPPLAIGFNLLMSSALGALSAAGTLYAARRAPEFPSAPRSPMIEGLDSLNQPLRRPPVSAN